jgi:hypothetical protein
LEAEVAKVCQSNVRLTDMLDKWQAAGRTAFEETDYLLPGQFLWEGISKAMAEIAMLRARLEALEEPPIVPEGWEIKYDANWETWGFACRLEGIYIKVPQAVLEAREWANKHDKRPHHAADKGNS